MWCLNQFDSSQAAGSTWLSLVMQKGMELIWNINLYIYSVQHSQHMQVSAFIQKSVPKNRFLADLIMTFLIQGSANVYSKLIHGLGGSPSVPQKCFLTENFLRLTGALKNHSMGFPGIRNDTLQLQSLFCIKSWSLAGSWLGTPLPNPNLTVCTLGMSCTTLISSKIGWIHYLNSLFEL